jgi:transposase
MGQHHRAALGPAGRAALVELVKNGQTFRQAAACLNVSPATAHRWWRRWRDAGERERSSGRWACDRSSRPRRTPSRTAPELERRICEARRRTNLGPERVSDFLCDRTGWSCQGESVFEVERGECRGPVVGSAPALLGVLDGEVDELAGGLLGREVSSGLDRLAHLAVERLDVLVTGMKGR